MRLRVAGLLSGLLLFASGCGDPESSGPGPDEVAPVDPPVSLHGDCGPDLASALRAWGRSRFSGVAVFDGPGGRCILSAGVADASRGLDNDPATVFRAGSYTKLVTEAAFAELFVRGAIAPGDRVGAFFPDMPADKGAIRIEELLDHRSGLDSIHGFDGERMTRGDALDRIAARPLLFEPGAGESYSNSGYTLLAAILEEVTGRSYREAVRDLVLTLPDGSIGVGWWSGPHAVKGVRARALDGGKPVPMPPELGDEPWVLEGAGGMASSVPALVDLHRALEAGDSISPAAWELLTRDAGPALTAFGGGSGHNYGVVHYPEGWIGAAASNDSRFRAEDLLNGLMPALVRSEPLPRPVAAVPADPRVVARILGDWELHGGGRIAIAERDRSLVLVAVEDEAMARLFPPPEGWDFPRDAHVGIVRAALDDGTLAEVLGLDRATPLQVVGTAWEEMEWRTYVTLPGAELAAWVAYAPSGALLGVDTARPAPEWELVATGASRFSTDPPPGLPAPRLTLDASVGSELTLTVDGAGITASRPHGPSR